MILVRLLGLGLAYGVERLARCGVDTGGRVFAGGGGARSAAYTQFLADVLDRPVLAADADEATARGAAVQALAVATGRTVAEMAERWRPPSRWPRRPPSCAPSWPTSSAF